MGVEPKQGLNRMCPHVQAVTDWVPAVIAAQGMQGAKSDGMLCSTCCHPIAPAEQAAGSCNQGHNVGLELRTGRAHCLVCRMCMAPDALAHAQQAVQAARKMLGSGMTPGGPSNDPAAQVLSKRRRLSRRQQHLPPLSVTPPHSTSTGLPPPPAAPSAAPGFSETLSRDGLPLGLRGLNNLGNTCFMNSVLQAFLHTPLVRLYYLGEGHAPAVCRWQSSRPCLGCEMDSLFTSMYSGERQPFSPVDFLYSWWCQADKLAEYQQQDAHEFYLSALSALSGASFLVFPDTHTKQRGAAGEELTSARLLQPGDLLSQATPPHGAQGSQQQQQAGQGVTSGHVSATGLPDRASELLTEGAAPDLLSQQPQSSVAAALGSAHPHAAGRSSSSSGSGQCGSQGAAKQEAMGMVDAVFGGLLRSDVRCSVCGHTSSAYDPFLDISLDLLAASKAMRPTSDPPTTTAPATAQRHPSASAPQPHNTAQRRATAGGAGATPTPEASSMDNVSGADGPQGVLYRSAPTVLQHGAAGTHTQGRGGARPQRPQAGGVGRGAETAQGSGAGGAANSGGPAGASESCSLGDRRLSNPHLAHTNHHNHNNNHNHQLTRRPSESSVQDGDMSHRVTPEISDVSSLLVVGDLASQQPGAARPQPTNRHANGRPPAPAPPATTAAPTHPAARGRPARPKPSLEFADSPVQNHMALAGELMPLWESPLDDSLASPLRPRPGGPQPPWLSQRPRPDGTPGSLAVHRAHPHKDQPTQGEHRSLDDVLMDLQMDGESSAALVGGGDGNGADEEVVGSRAAGARGGVGTKGGAARKKGSKARSQNRSQIDNARNIRCGECHTCLNRHLKKACLRNKAVKDAPLHSGDNASAPVGPSGGMPPTGDVDSRATPLTHGQGDAAMEVLSTAGPAPSPPPAFPRSTPEPQLTPEPSDLVTAAEPEASMIEEPACSHLAMQTVAWPVGQGQQGVAPADSRQETGETEGKATQGKRAHQANSSAAARADKDAPAVPLSACLAHFIQEEALHASEAWVCSHCRRRQQAIKQMSIRRLPPVLCLHVKRFEQALGSVRVVRKLHTRLAFPTGTLDMTPFMTATLLHQRYQSMATGGATHSTDIKQEAAPHDPAPFPIAQPSMPPAAISAMADAPAGGGSTGHNGVNGGSGNGLGTNITPDPELSYSLFSVICHKGDITGGHYVSYVRCSGAWFCCDDAWVTMVGEEEVAQCQAYMLFYTQAKYDQRSLKWPS